MNFKLRGFQWNVTLLRTHVDDHCRSVLIKARPEKLCIHLIDIV